MMPTCTPPAVIRSVEPAWPKDVYVDPKGPDVKATVSVILAADGSVAQVAIAKTTGLPLLDQSAIDAVKQFRFQPPHQQCTLTPYGVDVTFSHVAVPAAYDPCNHEAFALNTVTPEFPAVALSERPGTVLVPVLTKVDAAGKVQYAAIDRGSGNMAMDQAAIAAARHSVFTPKMVDCKAVDGGAYLFKVPFDPSH